MDDVDLIYFKKKIKIQLPRHVTEVNWDTWINLRPFDMDD
jgi:hypothetical protein